MKRQKAAVALCQRSLGLSNQSGIVYTERERIPFDSICSLPR